MSKKQIFLNSHDPEIIEEVVDKEQELDKSINKSIEKLESLGDFRASNFRLNTNNSKVR